MNILYRNVYALTVLLCVLAMAAALYAQYHLGMEPCPLCVFQRIGFIAVGVLAWLAWMTGRIPTVQRVLSGLAGLAALAGAGVAGRQVWLQHLPADQVPQCGPGLDYMLETMPFSHMLSIVLSGSGECADTVWRLLGRPVPEWSLLLFGVLAVLLLWRVCGRRR